MITVGSFEAKTNLSRLIDQVSSGETVTITKHGIPVARLIPAEGVHADRKQVVARLRQLSNGLRLEGESIKDLIQEGRKH